MAPRLALRAALAEASLASPARMIAAALDAHAVQIRLACPDGRVRRGVALPETWTAQNQEALAHLAGRIAGCDEALIIEEGAGEDTDGGELLADAGIVACAGVPLDLGDGTVIGSLCAVDLRPHRWTERELDVLREAAEAVAREVRLRVAAEESDRSERYFRALIETADEVTTVLDGEGRILYESPSVKRVLGYTPEELVGRIAFDFVHPDDVARVREAFGEVVRTPGRVLSVEYRFRHRSGEWRMLASVGTNGLEDPALGGVAVSSRDVSARYAAEEELRVQKAYFQRLFESAPEAIVMLDTDDRVLHANPEFTRLFGYAEDEAVGRPINLLISPESEREQSRAITDRIAAGETVSVEATRLHKDGTRVEVSILGTPVEMEGDQIGVFGIYRDITERKKTEARLAAHAEELRALSLTDELTGLANRRGFVALAEQRLRLARRADRRLVVIFVDVDDMKEINDAFGHAVGDRALIDAAEILKSTFRESDVRARVGGDEFALLVWLDDDAGTRMLLTRLHENVDHHNTHSDRPFTLSMSVGTARCDPAPSTSLDDLLRQADAAMYQAKRARDGDTARS